MVAAVASVVLGGLLAAGGWERWQRDRAHRRIAIRVHVNGTRGKSTVTRLVAAALRASGRRTLAKTTGTAARLILPDGTEQPVVRRAPPSIREQLWCLREARRRNADAIVLECMAIDPALQAVSEHGMIRATIGVITNARPDHADVMGATAADVARALTATVPDDGVLVLGDVPDPAPFEAEARRRRTTVVRPAADLAPGTRRAWQHENLALALAVTRAVGLADDVALDAMGAAPEDPGAMSVTTWTVAGRTVAVVDASAANDPESLARLLDGEVLPGERLFVFNHRADRPLRLRQFAAADLWRGPGISVLVTGDTPDCATRKQVGLALEATRLGFTPLPLLARTLRDQLIADPRIRTVVLCGNTKHLDARGVGAAVAGDRDRG